jgi:hypothetical protein
VGLAKTRPALAVLAALSVTVAGCGGGGEGCLELCEKDDECLGGINVESCTATCEELAEDDDAYADAVAERAACIDGLACEEIFFECRPSDS